MPARAWISQEESDGRVLRTFGVHVQDLVVRGAPVLFRWGPDGVPLSDALEWARARAGEVFVDIGGRRYSASPGPIRDRGVEEWPGDEVVLSWAATADPLPAGHPWRGQARIVLEPEEFEPAARGFLEALQSDPLVDDASGAVDADACALEATMTVVAPGEEWASRRTLSAFRRAVTAHTGSRDLLEPDRQRTRVARM